MPRFVLLLSPARPELAAFSPDQIGTLTRRFVEWVAARTVDGVIVSGARLEEKSIILSRGAGATTVAERDRRTGDLPAGYFVIEAEDLNAALALAADCPGADPGTIEVYQIDPSAAVAVDDTERAPMK
jgi:hypothetical protein